MGQGRGSQGSHPGWGGRLLWPAQRGQTGEWGPDGETPASEPGGESWGVLGLRPPRSLLVVPMKTAAKRSNRATWPHGVGRDPLGRERDGKARGRLREIRQRKLRSGSGSVETQVRAAGLWRWVTRVTNVVD